MRKSVAPRGATPAWGSGRVGARSTAMSLIAVVLTFVMVWSQPAAALLRSSNKSPASTSQATMPDADSVARSGSLPPSITPSPPARLTGYHQGLLASTVAVPPVATSHPPQPDWIYVMSITGTSATPNVGLRGGVGGSHTIYLRYKEVGDTTWNSTIFQADTRGSYATVPIVMTGLTPNTNYEIQVSFDNSDWSPSEDKTFTTKSASATLPTVSSVKGEKRTACSARIEITFPNPDRDSLLVYFRWKQDVTGATWSNIHNYPSGGTGASSQLGLSPSTTYVAQATMDHNFVNGIVTSEPFTTTSAPYVSNVVADPVGDTTATLTATRRNFCNWFPTYHFRYRVKGTETWITRAVDDYDRFITLTGLTPLTTYEVEVSFHKIFSHPFKIEFRTGTPDPPVPSLVAINLVDAQRTELTVVVKVADAENAEVDQKVHLLYQNLRANTFSTLQSTPITDSEAEFPLSGLISGTRYGIWASLDDSLLTDTLTPETKPNEVLSAEFTTIPPGVIGVSPQTTGQTTARLTVTIAEPNGQDQTVYAQYRATSPEGNWVNAGETPTTRTDTAIVNLTGLTSDTEYQARASLDSSFPEDETVVSGTFRTLPPGVTGLSVKDRTQTSATIVVELSAANGSTLYLIYRPVGGTWAGTQETVSQGQTSVEFPLTGLMSGTEYEVRISYDSRLLDQVGQNTPKGLNPQQGKTVKRDGQGSIAKDDPVDFNKLTFSTLPPSVVSVAVDDQTVSQTGATVTVTVKAPNGTAQVHIRYSTASNFPSGSTETESKVVPTTTNSNGVDTIDFVLTGLSASSFYYVEASYESAFPDSDATESTDFTTKPPSPAVFSVEVLDSVNNEITKTSAKARVLVTNPDGAAEVHIRYSTDSSFGQGSTIVTDSATPETNDTYVYFTFSDLTSGTTYDVQASYDDTYPASTATKSTDFTTDPPAIADVEVDDQYTTQTGAKVTVEVEEPNNDFPHLHYRTADSAWYTIDPDGPNPHTVVFDANTDTYIFDLTGLSSGTEYTVYASYDSTPPSTGATLAAAQSDTFTTVDPNITDVEVDDQSITQTAATVSVTVDEPNSTPVQLHYKKTSESTWSGPMSATADPSTKKATFALDDLTSGTGYTVFASYDSTPPSAGTTLAAEQTDTFITDPPSVKKVEATGKTDTTAEITVTIAEPNGETQTVSVRYQTTPSGNWVTIQPDPTADHTTAVVNLGSLTANTQYRVEATLSGSFAQGIKSTTFTTDSSGPGVSKVVMSGETQTGATATITIANVTAATAVYLQYREPGSNTWSHPPQEGASTTATPGTAVINLSGLASGTQYEVQASLDNTFEAGVQSATFTTEPPSASAVSVIEESARSAKVRVTVSEPNEKTTLFLRYGTSGNWRGDFASNVSLENVDFTLSGLEPDSTYTVEASFDSTFPQDATATDTFSTPHLDAPVVVVTRERQTTARVGITFSSPDDQDGVVFYRHRENPAGSWSDIQAAIVTGGSATANLSGLTSDTEYKVEASLSRSFPSNATGSKTFTTEPPGVDKVELKAGTITETAATVIITISAPNGQNQTVYLEYDTSVNTDQGTWGNSDQDSSSDDEAIIDLSGLLSGIQYTVRASLTDDYSGETRTATFTTSSTSPHVSRVEVTGEDIEQTGATATISIANVTAATNVYLRYRTSPSGAWSDPILDGASTATDPGTATIEMTGLTSGTQYEVQASLDSNFAAGVQSATFTTEPPSASAVSVIEENSRSAKVRVTVSEPNEKTTLFLRYGTSGNWRGDFASNVSLENVDFTLSGLEPDSTYQVEASFDSDFPQDATATGTVHTPHLNAPTVDVPTKTQTTATVGITFSSPDDQDGVFYRHRETPAGSWSSIRAAVVTGGSATATLSGLTSNTEYTVEASLSRSFPPNATGSFTFTTEPPGVDKVEVTDKTETTAEVTVTISAPNGESQTVYLEYDTSVNTDQGTWGNSEPGSSSDDEATINLSGLSSGTQYTVRASLTDDFSGETRTATFTTSSTSPHVSRVEVPDEDIEQTVATATISIANVTAETDVYLRYRTTPSGAWSDPILEGASTATDPATASIELSGLTSGTQYQVKASLVNSFTSGVQTASFTTKPPSVDSVTVSGETQSTATVIVEVSHPNGQPVYLQYRTGTDTWTGRFKTVAADESSVEFTLRGLSSSTTYTVQASYDSTFDTGVESDMFTTSATPSTPRPRPRPPGGSGNTGGSNTGGSNNGGGRKNQAPEFMEGTRTVRSVIENTPSGEDIGKPIPADDPENDDLTYSLVGPDAGDFDVEDDSGQLLTRSPLDFETKTHFLVTVSVRDGMDSEGGDDTRRDDQILVAILVTDEDETPNQPPALTETQRTVRMVAENTRSGVAVGDPIEAIDPEGDALTYSLNQRDGKYFDIVETSGQLLTRSPLDFETKAGYMVSVSVRDGKDTRGSADSADDDTIMVTVVVTDQEEPGTVTLSALRPRVGIPLTAVLTDPDGGVTDVGWVWERSEDRAGWTAISDATSTAYTPTTEDEGHYLRVTASYEDRRGGSKTASAEPDAPVTEGIDEEFTDVDDTNVHKPAIDSLASQGVFVDTECGDELFCPDLPMTRWAMAVWILRILADEPDTVIGVSRFADIAPGHWWIRYVERLADRKITIGCKLEPFRYCPDRPVTRAQMASFLVRALDLEPAPSAGFTDTDRTVHAANIDTLFAAGITIGCKTEPLRYCPYEPVTRAQMATFLYRMAPRLDRQALVAIFDATGGPNWKRSTNWITDEPIGEWYGVGTDSGGRVTGLELVDNGLNGAIPPEIAILTNLEDLQLADNVLLGCIPEGARDIPRSDLDGYDLPYCE